MGVRDRIRGVNMSEAVLRSAMNTVNLTTKATFLFVHPKYSRSDFIIFHNVFFISEQSLW